MSQIKNLQNLSNEFHTLEVFNFGIGCIQFTPSEFFPEILPLNDYAVELCKILERITTISNLKVLEIDDENGIKIKKMIFSV